MQATNNLPVEVLSRIFVLGENMYRGPRTVGLPYVGFQDLVVQVCRRWRAIAIGTPEICEQCSSKPIHPLDDEQQDTQALEIIAFIEQHGGTMDRWKSLMLVSKKSRDVFTVVGLIATDPGPALQFLSLTSEVDGNFDEVQEASILQDLLSPAFPSLIHGPNKPRLRHVEVIGLSQLVFGTHSPRVPNLTIFVFVCSPTMPLPSHQQFSALLCASPQLEFLSVDVHPAVLQHPPFEFAPPEIVTSLQVRLPLLRSFSLDTGDLHQWCLQLLQIIDAPGIEYFSINTGTVCGISFSLPEKLYEYLGRGRVNGALQSDAFIKDDVPGTGPIFPLLKHLNVESMTRFPEEITRVFSIFPLVTHVTLGGVSVLGLSEHPSHLPNASHFTYIDDGSLVLCLAGFPRCRAEQRAISTLVVCTGRPEQLCGELALVHDRNYLESERHYHLPGLVDHLVIRRVDQKPVAWEGVTGEVSEESNELEHIDIDPELDTDKLASTDDLPTFMGGG